MRSSIFFLVGLFVGVSGCSATRPIVAYDVWEREDKPFPGNSETPHIQEIREHIYAERRIDLQKKITPEAYSGLTDQEINSLIALSEDSHLNTLPATSMPGLMWKVYGLSSGKKAMEGLKLKIVLAADKLKDSNPDVNPIADSIIYLLRDDVRAVNQGYFKTYADFGWVSPVPPWQMEKWTVELFRQIAANEVLLARSGSN